MDYMLFASYLKFFKGINRMCQNTPRGLPPRTNFLNLMSPILRSKIRLEVEKLFKFFK